MNDTEREVGQATAEETHGLLVKRATRLSERRRDKFVSGAGTFAQTSLGAVITDAPREDLTPLPSHSLSSHSRSATQFPVE